MSLTNPLGPDFRPIEQRDPRRPAPGSQDAADYDAGLHADSPRPPTAATNVPQPADLCAAVARLAWALYLEGHDMSHPRTAELAHELWSGDDRSTPGRRARWHGRARVLLAQAHPTDAVAVVTTNAEHELTASSVVVVAGRQVYVPERTNPGGVLFWPRVAAALAEAGYALNLPAGGAFEGYVEITVRELDGK